MSTCTVNTYGVNSSEDAHRWPFETERENQELSYAKRNAKTTKSTHIANVSACESQCMYVFVCVCILYAVNVRSWFDDQSEPIRTESAAMRSDRVDQSTYVNVHLCTRRAW